jgi:hypothetical protein
MVVVEAAVVLSQQLDNHFLLHQDQFRLVLEVSLGIKIQVQPMAMRPPGTP